jgi:hypothetical protein
MLFIYTYCIPQCTSMQELVLCSVKEIFPTRRRSSRDVFYERKPVLEIFSQVQRVKELFSFFHQKEPYLTPTKATFYWNQFSTRVSIQEMFQSEEA